MSRLAQRLDLNCSRLTLMSFRWDGSVSQIWDAKKTQKLRWPRGALSSAWHDHPSNPSNYEHVYSPEGRGRQTGRQTNKQTAKPMSNDPAHLLLISLRKRVNNVTGGYNWQRLKWFGDKRHHCQLRDKPEKGKLLQMQLLFTSHIRVGPTISIISLRSYGLTAIGSLVQLTS